MKNIFKKSLFIMGVMGIGLSGCNYNGDDVNKNTNDSIPGFSMSNLDTSYKPCENFYMYATGGWQKLHPIPKTESRWGAFNILAEQNEEKIKKIILDASDKKTEKGTIIQQIGDLYKSVMDTAAIEKKGISPIKPFLEEVDKLKSTKDLPVYLARNKVNGLGTVIFYSEVSNDEKNANKYALYLGQSGLTLPDRDYYLKDDDRYKNIRNEYIKYLTKIFELTGENKAKAEKDAQKVLNLETKLAKISMSRIEMRIPEKNYNPLSKAELNKLSPAFNFTEFFDSINVKVDTIIVKQKDYIANLSKLLTEIPFEDWKIYFKSHLINSFAPHLSSDFEQAHFDFFSGVLKGVTEMKPLEKRAVKFVNNKLAMPVGKLFVKEYFPESSKKMVESMIEELRSAYIERVKNLDWMSDSTKAKAIEKLHAFTYKIGYPDEWKDYSSIDITPDDVIHNILEINKFHVRDNLGKLGKPVDKKEWGMPPQMVNAYYNPLMNEVVFPAGILQPPFFDPKADICINYGGIVAVIGHEFTHGFDDQGSKYDKNGNLNPWWTKEDEEKFKAKTQILVDQFDNYEPFPGIHVKGQLTLGENIADLGGLTLAYHAMENHFKKYGRPGVIAGFTPEQRFFLGWSQVWATNIRDEFAKQLITIDPHSPAQYRVNGPMSNMKEFKDAWHCKTGDPMVRPDSLQAHIW